MIRLTVPDIGKEEIEAVNRVLESGYLVQGKMVEQFEESIRKYVGTKYAIAVSSGTAALHLALLALGIEPGDEVIVPDFTFPATANVVELVGATPVFMDIDLATLNIDVNLIPQAISDRTKAIMPVHLFGQPADMKPILDIAEKNNLFIIEDATCALGAEYRGMKCGSIGHVGCFSFHPRKVITTGEGGMVVTDNEEIAEKVRSLRNHGMVTNQKGNMFAMAGFNYRMTDFQAAIGVKQLKKIDDIIYTRKRIAKLYDQLLANRNWIEIPMTIADANHTYQSYVVMINKQGNARNDIIKYLKDKGIETSIGTYALHQLEFYQNKYDYQIKDFPHSQEAYKNSLALPIYSSLMDNQIEFIISALRDFCD